MSAVELTALVLKLDPEEQAELMGALMDALDGADPNDGGSDSLTEAIRRSEELDAGTVKPLSKEEFWRGLRHG